MSSNAVRWPNSLWAAATPSGPDCPELTGTQQADVVIIGGGFTGLSTALHLREANVDVAIVEAAEPGWGASGRNNGQVIPTLSRPDPDDIIKRHGAAGERFVAMLRDSAAMLFEVVKRYNIAAEQEQAGWVQPVHSPGRIKIAERRVQQWSKLGARSNCCRANRRGTCSARMRGMAVSGTGPAATSIRWRWHAALRARCSASVGGSIPVRMR